MKFLNTLIFGYTFIFLLSGCGGKLKPDPSQRAIEAGFPTAEFRACGMLWHGLGVCDIEEGANLTTLSFQVQGYNSGAITIDSRDCELAQSLTYKKNALVTPTLTGPANKTCDITMTVIPQYDAQKNSGEPVYGFRGFLRIRVIKKGEYAVATTYKGSGDWKYDWPLSIKESNNVRLFMTSCGGNYDKTITPDTNQTIKIPLHEVTDHGKIQVCALEGFIQSPVYKDRLITALIAQYSPQFVNVPVPDYELKNGKIYIKADPTVSVLSVDDTYVFDNNASFKVDTSKFFIVRALTVKGRSAVGMWIPEKKGITWVQ